ncbi:MAG: sigma-70 family RNA polymerase sigma factor [Clostridiales bacterium]|nr:sigma-70 family RNA polymerase sigma factor [Clostridiales bacterium]MDR2752048.1 sigma-70 family RNA polymerase sigma factor [Clostridiales bacterium]
MSSSASDYDLIKSCLQGNQNDFAEIVSRYKNLVYSVILRMVNDKEEANDLAQDVFLKIYKNLDKYYPEGRFSTWTIKITSNHVIDYMRKKRQSLIPIEEVEHELGTTESPEDAFILKERREQLQSVVSGLPDMYRIPIMLFHEQGLSYQEISDITNEPLSKVKNRIFRGRKILKESLLKLKREGRASYGV